MRRRKRRSDGRAAGRPKLPGFRSQPRPFLQPQDGRRVRQPERTRQERNPARAKEAFRGWERDPAGSAGVLREKPPIRAYPARSTLWPVRHDDGQRQQREKARPGYPDGLFNDAEPRTPDSFEYSASTIRHQPAVLPIS
ncbi:hypothetical protein ACFVIK_13645 [Paenibacillus chitinolyticus]|uniref:hypothetical protein n=1 Tax=Paenibacillus chitinolyticus TaxID=79263 RepID=UPI0036389F2B